MPKLPLEFYTRTDVLQISRDLLGKVLCSTVEEGLTEAVIVEVEAYAGINDKASHAYGDRRTARTEKMYCEGGIAYIYLCYGMYSLFNVVTNVEGVPQAVLIRGAVPVSGHEWIQFRSGKERKDKKPLIGPGKLGRGMGLHYSLTGTSLLGDLIWIEDRGIRFPESLIQTTPRIGIDYAGDDALLPYRFVVQNPEEHLKSIGVLNNE